MVNINIKATNRLVLMIDRTKAECLGCSDNIANQKMA